MAAISTIDRVFVNRLRRELAVLERAAASAIAPGEKQYIPAFNLLFKTLSAANGPIKAATIFRDACERLRAAQKHQFNVNCNYHATRSGYLELMTLEVAHHPLVSTKEEGILVRVYRCLLRRRGHIFVQWGTRAFVSFHALARLSERADVDLLSANGVLSGCGFAGHLMRTSPAHLNTNINLTIGDLTVTGVLRSVIDDEGKPVKFFDVLTVLTIDDTDHPHKQAQREQGIAITAAVLDYISADSVDPRGYGDGIAVLPFERDDYVSRVGGAMT